MFVCEREGVCVCVCVCHTKIPGEKQLIPKKPFSG